MKAGFEVYRAFRKDCEDVKREIRERGKLGEGLPVMASGGEKSPLSEVSRRVLMSCKRSVLDAQADMERCIGWGSSHVR
jgi:hypothetical protein